MKAGVYTITAPNGKVYVGSAVHFGRRWQIHRNRLRRQVHENAPLQAAWNKHGGDALRFDKIIICKPEHVVFYEQLAIDALQPAMNICQVAGNTLGYKHTEETKAKFGERPKSFGHAGKRHSAETKARISALKAGRPNESSKGRVLTDAERARISATLKARYRKENHPNYGKKFSVDRRKKLSEAHIGLRNGGGSVPVVCQETGEVFPSAAEAARCLAARGKVMKRRGGPYIAAAARGAFPSAYGYTWALALPEKTSA